MSPRERVPSATQYALVDASRLRQRDRLPSRPDFGEGLYPVSSDPAELRRVDVEQARAIEMISATMATKDDVRAVENGLGSLGQQFAIEHTKIRSTVATIVAIATLLGVILQAALKFL